MRGHNKAVANLRFIESTRAIPENLKFRLWFHSFYVAICYDCEKLELGPTRFLKSDGEGIIRKYESKFGHFPSTVLFVRSGSDSMEVKNGGKNFVYPRRFLLFKNEDDLDRAVRSCFVDSVYDT